MAEWLKRQSHNKCEDWNGQVVKRDRVTREKQLVCLRVVLVDLNKIYFYNFSSFKHLFKDYLLGTLQDILAGTVKVMIKSWNSKSNDQVLESDSPTSGAFPVNSWHGGLIFVLHASDENQICFLLLPICMSCVFSLHWLIYPNFMAIQKCDKPRYKRDSDTRKVWRFCLIRCWFRPKQRTDCNWFAFFDQRATILRCRP